MCILSPELPQRGHCASAPGAFWVVHQISGRPQKGETPALHRFLPVCRPRQWPLSGPHEHGPCSAFSHISLSLSPGLGGPRARLPLGQPASPGCSHGGVYGTTGPSPEGCGERCGPYTFGDPWHERVLCLQALRDRVRPAPQSPLQGLDPSCPQRDPVHVVQAHLSRDLGPLTAAASGKGWALHGSAGVGS